MVEGDQTNIGDIQNSESVAVGAGATAVHVDALGDIGDVITGTKISLVNQAVAPRVASRHQVSPPPVDYIERMESEAALSELLTADYGDFHIVYLYGLPGAGKSWLARKVASLIEEIFVDGILAADLQTSDIRTAVWNFIEPYDERISRTSLTNANEFTAAMQTAFGDRRILVVLDHLQEWRDNWREIRNWMPDKCRNCVVLLIAHQPPSRLHENESSYRLSGMTSHEAVQMFTGLLSDEDGTAECDQDTMLALAKKLDFVPGAISAVARDINVKLMSPGDYLEALSIQLTNEQPSPYLQGLERIFQNLPQEGKDLFPFLGILRNAPWTENDLYAISLMTRNKIDIGLAQLKRAGIIDCLEPSSSYKTPLTIGEFALQKLIELGGQQLVQTAMTLRSADLLRTVELILRYAQQSLLGECWQDKNNRSLIMESVCRQFDGSVATSIRKSPETNLFALHLDPLQDFFENFVLRNHPYVQHWLDMLQAANFSIIRKQLEEVFDWAVEQEDWALVRRFGNRIGVNSAWILNTELNGHLNERSWTKFDYAFALLKDITATKVEVLRVSLKGTHMKSASWTDCQLVAMEWIGLHMVTSRFERVDMIGMVMPAGVITGSDFVDVDARFGDFRGTIFQQCVFHNVNFRGAKLENAKFIDCYFDNVDFRLTEMDDPYTKYLSKINLNSQ
jgi:hypothetical protein